MPFFKAKSKLVYYAHVPKCGGSAVEHFIEARAGKLAFVDQKYMSQPEAMRWSKTSPQHINVDALSRIIPLEFFDAAFTIVRHPMIETFYKADFERFGYVTGEKKPKAAAPELSPQIIAARDAEIKAANSAMAKASQMAGKIRRKIGK